MTKRLIAASCAAIAALCVATAAPAQETGLVFHGVQMEQFEHRWGDENERLFVWDGDAFVGTDEIKLRWLGEGEYDTRANAFETLENRLVVQVPVSDFFDAKGGIRVDTPKGPDRVYGVLGFAGLAPQWFEIDADLFVSEKGNASARLDIEYEILLTNRLILTPSIDIDAAFSDDRPVGVGDGVNSIEVGLRLSYDVLDRAISPYIGIVYEQKFGQTADFARDEGEDTKTWFLTVGTRILF